MNAEEEMLLAYERHVERETLRVEREKQELLAEVAALEAAGVIHQRPRARAVIGSDGDEGVTCEYDHVPHPLEACRSDHRPPGA